MVTIIKKGSSRDIIYRQFSKRNKNRKYIDIRKYCGILLINEDPMKLQKEWRNEWE
jgi:hypothetical protein